VDEVVRPGLPLARSVRRDHRPAVIVRVAVPVILGHDDIAVVWPNRLDNGDMPVDPDNRQVRAPLCDRSNGRGLVDRKAVFSSAGRPVHGVNWQSMLRSRDIVDLRFDEGHVVGAVGPRAARCGVLVGRHAPVRRLIRILEVVGCERGNTAGAEAFAQRACGGPRRGGRCQRRAHAHRDCARGQPDKQSHYAAAPVSLSASVRRSRRNEAHAAATRTASIDSAR